MRLARLAKSARVTRFLYSSSCSSYGQAGDDLVDETAELHPITAYAVSKVRAERDVAASGGSGGDRTITVTWSQEYLALYNRLAMWGGLLVGIIVVTVFLMTAQP